MANRNITALTNITGANNNAYSWNFQPTYTGYNDNQNPQFNRTVTLTSTGVLITVAGASAGIPIASLTQALAAVCPAITWPPVINPQPSNVTIGYGNATSITLAATDEVTNGGGADLTYQWKFAANGVNVAASTPYANVTTNHLNISNSAGLYGVGYYCNVTNPSGTNQSNTSILFTDPYISTQPSNVSVAHPAPANFSVVAVGNSALSYQWKFSTNSTNVGGGVYSGNTTNTLSISNSTGLNGTEFYVVVSDSGGTESSNNCYLTVT